VAYLAYCLPFLKFILYVQTAVHLLILEMKTYLELTISSVGFSLKFSMNSVMRKAKHRHGHVLQGVGDVVCAEVCGHPHIQPQAVLQGGGQARVLAPHSLIFNNHSTFKTH
jgi:hypothetical protein